MKHVLSVFVENQTGVLVRVVSMFSRREFNIDSLSVGVTETPDFSRITVVVHGDENLIEQMIKHPLTDQGMASFDADWAKVVAAQ